MNAWIVLAIVGVVLLGALLPLLRKDQPRGAPPQRDGRLRK